MNQTQTTASAKKIQRNSVLRSAFTSDPDDAYAWWALATGRLALRNHKLECSTAHIQDINEACRAGVYDIAAISSAAYPELSSDYAILSAGASVGRGYGPALAAREIGLRDQNRPVKVAIPGEQTTGALLLRLFFPNVKTVTMRFDSIAPAILDGRVDAGVLIHEELLNWRAAGLRRLVCLGQKWFDETGLPIPVGLNIVHKRLGRELIHEVSGAILASMKMADANEAAATAWAMKYSREAEPQIGGCFIKMFANRDTYALNHECVTALKLLYKKAHDRDLIARVPEIEIV